MNLLQLVHGMWEVKFNDEAEQQKVIADLGHPLVAKDGGFFITDEDRDALKSKGHCFRTIQETQQEMWARENSANPPRSV